jgi:hypothetical protein
MVPTEQARYAYVIRYYGHLMTRPERLAYWHLVRTAKAMHGRSDWAAQTEARNKLSGRNEKVKGLSDDPEVLNLTREGLGVFVARTAQRILDERRAEVRFNYCCRCGALARTPKARQCRFCRHDWHKEITNSE